MYNLGQYIEIVQSFRQPSGIKIEVKRTNRTFYLGEHMASRVVKMLYQEEARKHATNARR